MNKLSKPAFSPVFSQKGCFSSSVVQQKRPNQTWESIIGKYNCMSRGSAPTHPYLCDIATIWGLKRKGFLSKWLATRVNSSTVAHSGLKDHDELLTTGSQPKLTRGASRHSLKSPFWWITFKVVILTSIKISLLDAHLHDTWVVHSLTPFSPGSPWFRALVFQRSTLISCQPWIHPRSFSKLLWHCK